MIPLNYCLNVNYATYSWTIFLLWSRILINMWGVTGFLFCTWGKSSATLISSSFQYFKNCATSETFYLQPEDTQWQVFLQIHTFCFKLLPLIILLFVIEIVFLLFRSLFRATFIDNLRKALNPQTNRKLYLIKWKLTWEVANNIWGTQMLLLLIVYLTLRWT